MRERGGSAQEGNGEGVMEYWSDGVVTVWVGRNREICTVPLLLHRKAAEAAPHSKTQSEESAQNHGHVLECGVASAALMEPQRLTPNN
jgi:hypothetical protein